MILIIDNYDSFTYNLVQYVGAINSDLQVSRNDKISLHQIKNNLPTHIIISPGPGTPKEAGASIDIIREFGNSIPILGICLGHQAIAVAYGGDVVRADEIIHGKTSLINHKESIIFNNIPNEFKATRYHSLIVKKETLPACLSITAKTINGIIMGVEHKNNFIFGVQFHPESIVTEYGKVIIKNFLGIKNENNH